MKAQNNSKKKLTSRLRYKKISNVKKGGDLDRDEIVKKLNGRTLMVYFVLLNKKLVLLSSAAKKIEERLDR